MAIRAGEVRRAGRAGEEPTSSHALGGEDASALEVAVRAIGRWRSEAPGDMVVAIDGHGASGKSTLTEALRTATAATVVHTDDFFAPVCPRGGAPRALGSFYEVDRLRAEALRPLLSGREAVFFPFDWESGALSVAEKRVAPNALILLEGVYSASPELADLVERAIYLSTPEAERLRRLRRRISPEEWDCEWLRAETAYFAEVRPPGSFDLVVPGTARAASPRAPVSVLFEAGLRQGIDRKDTDRP